MSKLFRSGTGHFGSLDSAEASRYYWVPDAKEIWVPGLLLEDRKGPKLRLAITSHNSAGSNSASERIVEIDRSQCIEINDQSVLNEAMEDLITLTEVSDAAILNSTRLRYTQRLIYTSIGTVLMSLNPFLRIEGLYGPHKILQYIDAREENQSAHVYMIPSRAYAAMRSLGRNQSILISGESGAGKTEAAKHCISFLTEVSAATRAEGAAAQSASSDVQLHRMPSVGASKRAPGERRHSFIRASSMQEPDEHLLSPENSQSDYMRLDSGISRRTSMHERRRSFVRMSSQRSDGDGVASEDVAPKYVLSETKTEIAQRVIAASPILEAFGNAQTIRNPNSSRFGKWMELNFDSNNKITGSKITSYLLEKSRVTSRDPKERNYHIFYQLLRGGSEAMVRQFGLTRKIMTYGYLNPVGPRDTTDPKDLKDAENFFAMMSAFKLMGFAEQEPESLLQIVASVLHLGNISFDPLEQGEASEVSKSPECLVANQWASDLLGVDAERLSSILCVRTLTTGTMARKSVISVRLSPQKAADTRDSLARTLYDRVFSEIIDRINIYSKSGNSNRCIGLLDIFGFEIFQNNSFEQFCINYCNEMLQNHFNLVILINEKNLYIDEGISCETIELRDNSPMISSMESCFKALDEEARIPRGSSKTWFDKMKRAKGAANAPKDSSVVSFPPAKGDIFVITHYAGRVSYSPENFLEKNTETLSTDVIALMNESTNKEVQTLFKDTRTPPGEASNGRSGAVGGNLGGASASSGKNVLRSISWAFQAQLSSLMKMLAATDSHFIRCIKSNDDCKPLALDSDLVHRQLVYSGVFEVVKIQQSGLPFRLKHSEFFRRYCSLIPLSIRYSLSNDPEGVIEALKTNPKFVGRLIHAQVGRTMTFLSSKEYGLVELARDAIQREAGIMMQSWLKTRCLHRHYVRFRELIVRSVEFIDKWELDPVDAIITQLQQISDRVSPLLFNKFRYYDVHVTEMVDQLTLAKKKLKIINYLSKIQEIPDSDLTVADMMKTKEVLHEARDIESFTHPAMEACSDLIDSYTIAVEAVESTDPLRMMYAADMMHTIAALTRFQHILPGKAVQTIADAHAYMVSIQAEIEQYATRIVSALTEKPLSLNPWTGDLEGDLSYDHLEAAISGVSLESLVSCECKKLSEICELCIQMRKLLSRGDDDMLVHLLAEERTKLQELSNESIAKGQSVINAAAKTTGRRASFLASKSDRRERLKSIHRLKVDTALVINPLTALMRDVALSTEQALLHCNNEGTLVYNWAGERSVTRKITKELSEVRIAAVYRDQPPAVMDARITVYLQESIDIALDLIDNGQNLVDNNSESSGPRASQKFYVLVNASKQILRLRYAYAQCDWAQMESVLRSMGVPKEACDIRADLYYKSNAELEAALREGVFSHLLDATVINLSMQELANALWCLKHFKAVKMLQALCSQTPCADADIESGDYSNIALGIKAAYEPMCNAKYFADYGTRLSDETEEGVMVVRGRMSDVFVALLDITAKLIALRHLVVAISFKYDTLSKEILEHASLKADTKAEDALRLGLELLRIIGSHRALQYLPLSLERERESAELILNIVESQSELEECIFSNSVRMKSVDGAMLSDPVNVVIEPKSVSSLASITRKLESLSKTPASLATNIEYAFNLLTARRRIELLTQQQTHNLAMFDSLESAIDYWNESCDIVETLYIQSENLLLSNKYKQLMQLQVRPGRVIWNDVNMKLAGTYELAIMLEEFCRQRFVSSLHLLLRARSVVGSIGDIEIKEHRFLEFFGLVCAEMDDYDSYFLLSPNLSLNFRSSTVNPAKKSLFVPDSSGSSIYLGYNQALRRFVETVCLLRTAVRSQDRGSIGRYLDIIQRVFHKIGDDGPKLSEDDEILIELMSTVKTSFLREVEGEILLISRDFAHTNANEALLIALENPEIKVDEVSQKLILPHKITTKLLDAAIIASREIGQHNADAKSLFHFAQVVRDSLVLLRNKDNQAISRHDFDESIRYIRSIRRDYSKLAIVSQYIRMYQSVLKLYNAVLQCTKRSPIIVPSDADVSDNKLAKLDVKSLSIAVQNAKLDSGINRFGGSPKESPSTSPRAGSVRLSRMSIANAGGDIGDSYLARWITAADTLRCLRLGLSQGQWLNAMAIAGSLADQVQEHRLLASNVSEEKFKKLLQEEAELGYRCATKYYLDTRLHLASEIGPVGLRGATGYCVPSKGIELLKALLSDVQSFKKVPEVINFQEKLGKLIAFRESIFNESCVLEAQSRMESAKFPMLRPDHVSDNLEEYSPDRIDPQKTTFKLPMHLVHMTSREAEAATSALLEEKSFLDVLSGMSNNEIEFVSTRKQLHTFIRDLEKAAKQPIVSPVEKEQGRYEIDEDVALIQSTITQQIVSINPQAIDEVPLVKVLTELRGIASLANQPNVSFRDIGESIRPLGLLIASSDIPEEVALVLSEQITTLTGVVRWRQISALHAEGMSLFKSQRFERLVFDEYISKASDVLSSIDPKAPDADGYAVLRLTRAARQLCWLAEINRLESFEEQSQALLGLARAISEQMLVDVAAWTEELKRLINYDELMGSHHATRLSGVESDPVSENNEHMIEGEKAREIEVSRRNRGILLYSIFRALAIIREDWGEPLVHAVLQADLAGMHLDTIALNNVLDTMLGSIKFEKHPVLITLVKRVHNVLAAIIGAVERVKITKAADADTSSGAEQDTLKDHLENIIKSFVEMKSVLDWVLSLFVRTREVTKFSNASKGFVTFEYRPPDYAHFEVLHLDSGDFMTIGDCPTSLRRLLALDAVDILCDQITSDAVMFKLASSLPLVDDGPEYAHLATFDAPSPFSVKLLGRQYASGRKQLRALISSEFPVTFNQIDALAVSETIVLIFEFDVSEHAELNLKSRLHVVLRHLHSYLSSRLLPQAEIAASFADFDLVSDLHSIALTFSSCEGVQFPLKSEIIETRRSVDKTISALKERCRLLGLARSGYDIKSMRPWSTTWLDLQRMVHNLSIIESSDAAPDATIHKQIQTNAILIVEGLQLLERAAELDSSDFNAQLPKLLDLSKRLQQACLLEGLPQDTAATPQNSAGGALSSWVLYQELAINSISRSIDGIVLVKQADVVLDHFKEAFLYNNAADNTNAIITSSSVLSNASTMASVADEVREFLMRVLTRSIGVDIRPIPENMFDLYFYSHLFLPVGQNVVSGPGGDHSWYRNYAQSAKVIMSSRLLFRRIGEAVEGNYVLSSRRVTRDDVEDGRILSNLETYRRAMLLCSSLERFLSDPQSVDIKAILSSVTQVQETQEDGSEPDAPINVRLVDKLLFDTPSFLLPSWLRPQDSLWETSSAFHQNEETDEILITLYDLSDALLAIDAFRGSKMAETYEAKLESDANSGVLDIHSLPEPRPDEATEMRVKSVALRIKATELRLQMYREILGHVSSAQHIRPRIILEQIVSTYRAHGADVPSMFRQLRDSVKVLNMLLCTSLDLDPDLMQQSDEVTCPLSDTDILVMSTSAGVSEIRRLAACYRVVWNMFGLCKYVIEGIAAEGKDTTAFLDFQSRALSAIGNAGSVLMGRSESPDAALADMRLCVLSISQIYFMALQLRAMVSGFECTCAVSKPTGPLFDENTISEVSRAASGRRGSGYLDIRTIVAFRKDLETIFDMYSRLSIDDSNISMLNADSTIENDTFLAKCREIRIKLVSFTEQYIVSDGRVYWIVERSRLEEVTRTLLQKIDSGIYKRCVEILKYRLEDAIGTWNEADYPQSCFSEENIELDSGIVSEVSNDRATDPQSLVSLRASAERLSTALKLVSSAIRLSAELDDFMSYASAPISAEQHARVLAEPVIHTLTTIAAIVLGIRSCASEGLWFSSDESPLHNLLSDIGNNERIRSRIIRVPTHEEVLMIRSRWSGSIDVYQYLIDSSDKDNSVSYWIYLWFWCRYNHSFGSDKPRLIDGKPGDDLFARFGSREVGYIHGIMNSALCDRSLRQFRSHIESFDLQSLLDVFSMSMNRPATNASWAVHKEIEEARGALIGLCVDTLALTVAEKPLGRYMRKFSDDIYCVGATLQALVALSSDAIGAISPLEDFKESSIEPNIDCTSCGNVRILQVDKLAPLFASVHHELLVAQSFNRVLSEVFLRHTLDPYIVSDAELPITSSKLTAPVVESVTAVYEEVIRIRAELAAHRHAAREELLIKMDLLIRYMEFWMHRANNYADLSEIRSDERFDLEVVKRSTLITAEPLFFATEWVETAAEHWSALFYGSNCTASSSYFLADVAVQRRIAIASSLRLLEGEADAAPFPVVSLNEIADSTRVDMCLDSSVGALLDWISSRLHSKMSSTITALNASFEAVRSPMKVLLHQIPKDVSVDEVMMSNPTLRDLFVIEQLFRWLTENNMDEWMDVAKGILGEYCGPDFILNQETAVFDSVNLNHLELLYTEKFFDILIDRISAVIQSYMPARFRHGLVKLRDELVVLAYNDRTMRSLSLMSEVHGNASYEEAHQAFHSMVADFADLSDLLAERKFFLAQNDSKINYASKLYGGEGSDDSVETPVIALTTKFDASKTADFALQVLMCVINEDWTKLDALTLNYHMQRPASLRRASQGMIDLGRATPRPNVIDPCVEEIIKNAHGIQIHNQILDMIRSEVEFSAPKIFDIDYLKARDSPSESTRLIPGAHLDQAGVVKDILLEAPNFFRLIDFEALRAAVELSETVPYAPSRQLDSYLDLAIFLMDLKICIDNDAWLSEEDCVNIQIATSTIDESLRSREQVVAAGDGEFPRPQSLTVAYLLKYGLPSSVPPHVFAELERVHRELQSHQIELKLVYALSLDREYITTYDVSCVKTDLLEKVLGLCSIYRQRSLRASRLYESADRILNLRKGIQAADWGSIRCWLTDLKNVVPEVHEEMSALQAMSEANVQLHTQLKTAMLHNRIGGSYTQLDTSKTNANMLISALKLADQALVLSGDDRQVVYTGEKLKNVRMCILNSDFLRLTREIDDMELREVSSSAQDELFMVKRAVVFYGTMRHVNKCLQSGLFYNINGRVEAQDTGVYGLSSALSTIDKKDCMLAVETYIRCAEFIRDLRVAIKADKWGATDVTDLLLRTIAANRQSSEMLRSLTESSKSNSRRNRDSRKSIVEDEEERKYRIATTGLGTATFFFEDIDYTTEILHGGRLLSMPVADAIGGFGLGAQLIGSKEKKTLRIPSLVCDASIDPNSVAGLIGRFSAFSQTLISDIESEILMIREELYRRIAAVLLKKCFTKRASTSAVKRKIMRSSYSSNMTVAPVPVLKSGTVSLKGRDENAAQSTVDMNPVPIDDIIYATRYLGLKSNESKRLYVTAQLVRDLRQASTMEPASEARRHTAEVLQRVHSLQANELLDAAAAQELEDTFFRICGEPMKADLMRCLGLMLVPASDIVGNSDKGARQSSSKAEDGAASVTAQAKIFRGATSETCNQLRVALRGAKTVPLFIQNDEMRSLLLLCDYMLSLYHACQMGVLNKIQHWYDAAAQVLATLMLEEGALLSFTTTVSRELVAIRKHLITLQLSYPFHAGADTTKSATRRRFSALAGERGEVNNHPSPTTGQDTPAPASRNIAAEICELARSAIDLLSISETRSAAKLASIRRDGEFAVKLLEIADSPSTSRSTVQALAACTLLSFLDLDARVFLGFSSSIAARHWDRMRIAQGSAEAALLNRGASGDRPPRLPGGVAHLPVRALMAFIQITAPPDVSSSSVGKGQQQSLHQRVGESNSALASRFYLLGELIQEAAAAHQNLRVFARHFVHYLSALWPEHARMDSDVGMVTILSSSHSSPDDRLLRHAVKLVEALLSRTSEHPRNAQRATDWRPGLTNLSPDNRHSGADKMPSSGKVGTPSTRVGTVALKTK